MLRGSEVSKDSHSRVKKIKTIKNLQTQSDQQWTVYVLRLKVTVVSQLTISKVLLAFLYFEYFILV